ncbi:MAG: beta-ketoacyl synthase chain length factor [Bacteroidales bacterium]|nr:beta-ketoacyl synthase chain length factor [Bacteroidales bacterium]
MMKEKIYINAASQIAPGCEEPDYRQFITPMEARRMGKLMKRSLATSLTALREAGIEHPDAIITGTFLGSVENTEALLMSLTGVSDAPMKPTNFMQSTHNTVSSMIGIRTASHGYNATYSHGLSSFESALLDALLQLELGEIENALVGLSDETSETFSMMLGKVGVESMDIASSIVVSRKAENALCRIADFSLSHGRAAFDAASKVQADIVLEAPLGYVDGARMIAQGNCASVLVVNRGRNFDDTSYALLVKADKQ